MKLAETAKRDYVKSGSNELNTIISASVVLYKPQAGDLRSLANSFAGCTAPVRLYIIDNSVASHEALFQSFGGNAATYFHGHGNIGFGAGHNLGIERAYEEGSDVHVIVNPDVCFNRDVIKRLADVVRVNRRIGLLRPEILNPDGTRQAVIESMPSPWQMLKRRLRKREHFTQTSFRGKSWRENGEILCELPVIAGCFVVARTKVLHDLGGFDERYFLYLEDVDLSQRASRAGFLNAVLPEIAVRHVWARESSKSVRAMMYHVASAFRYFAKWGIRY